MINTVSGYNDDHAFEAQGERAWRHPLIIITGYMSPFTLKVPTDDCAALLYVGCTTLILVIAVDRPSVVDHHVLGLGDIDAGLLTEGSLAILLWQFRFGDHAITLDTPLHVGLEDLVEFPSLSVAGLRPDETRLLTIVIQDEKGVVQRLREVSMPRLLLERMAPLLSRQITERSRTNLQNSYHEAIRRFNRRNRSLTRAFAAAKIKAPVT